MNLTPENEKTALAGAASSQNTHTPNSTGNSTDAQRQRILDRLRQGPASTIELRRDLDCMMPAARVFELKHRLGHNISTVWTSERTDAGKLHRVALYVLQPGGVR